MKPKGEFKAPGHGFQVTRREFLKLTGGGILVFFTVGELPFFTENAEGALLPTDFNAFLKIGEDGRAVLRHDGAVRWSTEDAFQAELAVPWNAAFAAALKQAEGP